MNPNLLEMLISEERTLHDDTATSESYNEVYRIDGMLDMTCLFELPKKDRPRRSYRHTLRAAPRARFA